MEIVSQSTLSIFGCVKITVYQRIPHATANVTEITSIVMAPASTQYILTFGNVTSNAYLKLSRVKTDAMMVFYMSIMFA